MVKAGEDYKNRKDDSRFKKWDDSINSVNDLKKSRVLIIGLTVLLSWIIISAMFSLMAGKSPVGDITGTSGPASEYEQGLNITYDPKSSMYIIEYNNIFNTTKEMRTLIYNDGPEQLYGGLYPAYFDNITSGFPVNITFKPYEKDLSTRVVVTLIKPTGNYTYMYANIPSEADKTHQLASSYEDTLKPIKEWLKL